MKRFAVVIVALTAGCMVGPDYKRPDAPVPTQFKELADKLEARPVAGNRRGAAGGVPPAGCQCHRPDDDRSPGFPSTAPRDTVVSA